MNTTLPSPQPRARIGARMRLTLSYAVFLVAAGAICIFGLYLVLRYVPDYPLTAANPRDSGGTGAASRTEILTAVTSVSIIILVALAIIGLVGGWFIAGWILRPLQRINAAARIAATGDLDHRIALSGRNDEFRQLADNFDHMLERLRDSFDVHERFAANASHELRTPLAISATMLDVAQRDPEGQNYPQLVERLRATNDRAIGLTESLLLLADANSLSSSATPVRLDQLALAVVKENRAEATARSVTLVTDLAEVTTTGDSVLLTQLLSNLVQNAVRHGSSPGNAIISTGSDSQRGTVSIRIASGGEQYTPEFAAHLSEPFLRGAGRARHPGEHHGYGLGLALVSRIAAVHGGTVIITARAEGGLEVTVTLPAAGSTKEILTPMRADSKLE